MKPGLLILSVIVFFLSLFLLFRYYTNAGEKSIRKRMANAKALIADGKTTTATYDSTYIAFRNQGTKKNKVINYSYQVNGKNFDGSQIIEELPTSQTFTVIYLPEDPAIHTVDPQDDINSLEKAGQEKPSGFWPWMQFVTSIATFYFVRKSYLNDLAEKADLERFYQTQHVKQDQAGQEQSKTKYLYLAGSEVHLNGNQQCENFIATQITTRETVDQLYSGIELIFENNKLSKAYDIEEGSKKQRDLQQDEIGLSLPNFHPNQILQFVKNINGTHQLGGKIPNGFNLPAFNGPIPFQYLGFINNEDSNFSWLPFSIHLTCAIYLNIENVFLDYADPLNPTILNKEAVERSDTSFKSELNQHSEIIFEKVNFDFIPSLDFDITGNSGIPNWIQYPEIPMCPKSGKRMKFLCQLHGGIPTMRSNLTNQNDNKRHRFERMNFWGDGDLFVFFEPTSKVACYFIQNT